MPQFTDALAHVRTMTRNGAQFEHVEHAIENAPGLDEEERAALWLIAWADGDPSTVAELLGRKRLDAVVVAGAV